MLAVPKSTIINGALYFAKAPTESATRSEPSSLGLSILIDSPDLIPFPTILHSFLISFSIANLMVRVKDGMTLERIAPSKLEGEIFSKRKKESNIS